MKTHKQLDVWIQAMSLVKIIYVITSTFPREEMFSLISHMRRAAVSILSNIAEGAGWSCGKEFAHFLDVAGGSLAELDTQLEIAQMLNYLSPDPLITQQLDSVDTLLSGQKKSIKGL